MKLAFFGLIAYKIEIFYFLSCIYLEKTINKILARDIYQQARHYFYGIFYF